MFSPRLHRVWAIFWVNFSKNYILKQSISLFPFFAFQLAWEYGIPFFETSAKNNTNIENAFSVLAEEILNKVSKLKFFLIPFRMN